MGDFLAKKTAGLTEPVKIIGPAGKEVECDAILDTGATRTSLDITVARKVELGPILGSVRVKSKTMTTGFVRRIEVPCKVVMLGKIFDVKVNITDRRDMHTKVLIGRNIIHGNFVVDVEKTHNSADIKDVKNKKSE